MRKSDYNKIFISEPLEKNRDLSHLHFEPGHKLAKETIKGLQGLGEILRKIHNRLIDEGYSIIEDNLYSPNGELLYERNQTKHL